MLHESESIEVLTKYRTLAICESSFNQNYNI